MTPNQNRPATIADFTPDAPIHIEAHTNQRHPNTICFRRILTKPGIWNITAGGQMESKATTGTIYPNSIRVRSITMKGIQVIEHIPGNGNSPKQLLLVAYIDTVEPWETIK